MKRYLVFAHEQHEAAGGWDDFYADYDDFEEACDVAYRLCYAPMQESHVVDSIDGVTMYHTNSDEILKKRNSQQKWFIKFRKKNDMRDWMMIEKINIGGGGAGITKQRAIELCILYLDQDRNLLEIELSSEDGKQILRIGQNLER